VSALASLPEGSEDAAMSEGLGAEVPAADENAVEGGERATWRIAVPAIAFGVAADLLLRGPPGAGLVVLSVAASVCIAAIARPRRAAWPFLIAAPLLMGFAAVRASLVLIFLDFVACVGLLILGASFSRAGDPVATRFTAYLVRGVGVIRALPAGVAAPVEPFVRTLHGAGRIRRLPRGLLITVPVLLVFLLLLGSSDAVFAHYLHAPFDAVPTPGDWPAQLVLIAFGTIAIATVLVYATRRTPDAGEMSDRGRSALRRGEWVGLLVGVDLIFSAFVIVQLGYFFGGNDLVLRREGLTYAEYARTGFIQLVIASVLTAALIGAAWRLGRRTSQRDDRLFSWLAGGLVALTLVVLVSAFRRLSLYERAYGWTWPRLLGHAIVVSIAVSLVCGLVWIARRRGRWLATAVLIAGLVTLLALNVMNPDRFIAQRNLARYRVAGAIDGLELGNLSPDAVPVILAALPNLPKDLRGGLEHTLACVRDDLARPQGIGSWNLARSRAVSDLEGEDLGSCGPRQASASPMPG
jgi:hypothetical protein